MFALVDCNNFYASCERLFRPDLKYTPIAVLSNNDGCIIARSAEVKALNINMAQPVFKLRHLIQKHGIVCFSSNYPLYADLSARVMQTLEELACEVEVYSIDEAFLNLNGFEKNSDITEFGLQIKHTVYKHVGLPVCVGIAPTKTLAKLANHAAKKYPATKSVVYLDSQKRIQKLLALVAVKDVWGVGRKISKKLNDIGIYTAKNLADSDPKLMRKIFSVNIEKTISELNGIVCFKLDEVPNTKQQIICSRSFSERVLDYQSMREAMCSYTVRAVEKLRQEKQSAKVISISLRTSALSKNDKQYANSITGKLQIASDDTRDFIELVSQLLPRIWRDGYRYAKAGVMICDFYGQVIHQEDLFEPTTQKTRHPNLMKVLDEINQTGIGKVSFAAEGLQKGWSMKQQMLSPAYTTRWSDLAWVR
ncbi:translesion error-prone DNA polymerase V subunit UmuC [Marinicellulosiphila megalodicopiae]|uniref:translesion error-prone DNA polymerase V subunit UmuC n=1 Tax=Marinicellulosiphila megalodicopiae TaxID=2724896 RepID=UPI003BB073E2